MSRYKLFACLLLAQAAALALGLWIHHRFAAESMAWHHSHSAEAGEAVAPVAGGARGAVAAAYGLTFLWIVGLQGLVGYLVLSRIVGEHSRWQLKHNEQSLQRARALGPRATR